MRIQEFRDSLLNYAWKHHLQDFLDVEMSGITTKTSIVWLVNIVGIWIDEW